MEFLFIYLYSQLKRKKWNKINFFFFGVLASLYLPSEPCCKICNFKTWHCRWKLLDFAELKRSSISFFEIEKPETAVSRWSRARTRAAKASIELQSAHNSVFARFCGSKFLVLRLFCRWGKVYLRMQRLVSLLYSIGLRQ